MRTNKFIFSLLLLLGCAEAQAQCTTTTVNGDLVLSSDMFLSGTYVVSGTFHILPGVTAYVQPYAFGGCGTVEIQATKIIIEGTIDGDNAGYSGGAGGAGAVLVTSLTGDIVALNTCSNADNTGQVTVEGGKGGLVGNGPGAGAGGSDGTSGSGPKQVCQNFNDEAGMIGGGGGAGGGQGGSYGGTGNTGGAGGDGTNAYTTNGVSVSTGFIVVAGQGGAGGNSGTTYGTQYGTDISIGSGGGGAGGGGRSYSAGLAGSTGGAGGGMVRLVASDTLRITASASIHVNGETGQNGGNGGSGGVSPKCCSDGCDDCGEATLSCGSGGGSGAGGGSGGGILIEATGPVNISGTLQARGGNGGSYGLKGNGTSCSYAGGGFCSGNDLTSGDGINGVAGGGGGGGRIKVIVAQDCGSANPVMNVTGGIGPQTAASSGTAEVICTTGIVEDKEVASLTLSPNPAGEAIAVQFQTASSLGNIIITVRDLSGRTVLSETVGAGHNNLVLDLSALVPGVYFCSLEGEQVYAVQKFIHN